LQEVERQAATRSSSGSQVTPQALAEIAIVAMRRAGYSPVDGSYEKINGNEAYLGLYRGSAKDVGKVTMRAAHIAIGRQLYVVAGFAPEKEFDLVDREIQPALKTFRHLTPVEASNVRPNRIQFYTVLPGDSWQSIAARQGKGYVNAATLAIMNDREVSAQPQAGERIKIIVEG
jgi:predicted Zn-dependent protease